MNFAQIFYEEIIFVFLLAILLSLFACKSDKTRNCVNLSTLDDTTAKMVLDFYRNKKISDGLVG